MGRTVCEAVESDPDLELAARQALFVDGEPHAPVLEQRSARVVAIPDPDYVHDAGHLPGCGNARHLTTG